MPIIGRNVAAVLGGLLVATGAADVIGSLIVHRSVADRLARWVDRVVNGAFRLAARPGISMVPLSLTGHGAQTGQMRITVTKVAGDGSIRHGELDTANRSDASTCEELIEQAALAVPPPYRPVRGRPTYQISADDTTVWVAEGELAGPLRELVMTVLAG